jgi:Fe-Mn family superoxide dismutase
MAFLLPELPYAYTALEPVIDARTMEIHHSKHHAAYTNNLNAALEGNAAATGLDIEGILQSISTFSPAIRNNGGGFYNHNLFWTILSSSSNAEQSLPVIQAIETELGGMEAFKTAFSQAAATRFGSGWAWLVKKADGTLDLASTSNAATPLTTDAKPLMTCDVWEHAYYIDTRNARPKYVENFWNVVNWDFASKNFA